jgi:SecD/SecF fusion protein
MSNSLARRMRTFLVVLAAFIGVFAVARMVAADPSAKSDESLQIGTMLVYQIDGDAAERSSVETYDAVVRVLKSRLKGGEVQFRRRSNGDIEIGIFGHDAKKAQHIKDLIQRAGNFDLQFVADRAEHKSVIERAKKDAKSKEVKDDQGRLLGRWVAVSAAAIAGLRDDPQIATRKAADNSLEVLVVHDDDCVTGADLKSATAATDERNAPAVNFKLTARGGEKLGRLTGNCRFDNGSSPKLAIIVDDHVLAAPVVRSRITTDGRITGNFTVKEVADIVAVLNSGTLPVKLQLVAEYAIDEKK